MKVKIEEISPIKKKLSIEVPEEDYKKALEQAYQKLGKTVHIKGFRKGKVPRDVLERYYGARTNMETVSELVDRNYRDALQQHSISAVGLPKISDLKINESAPVTFTAEVEVQPKVVAKHFENIKLKKNKIEVTDEEFQAEVLALRRAHAQFVPVEEGAAASEGHVVHLNYEGTIEGKPFEGGQAKNVMIQLGGGRFLPDFEKGVMGAKKGEIRDFSVPFPKDYGAPALAGKTAVFKVEVLEIKREELPGFDDEFAKDLGSYQTIEQVKQELKERMMKSKETRERGELFKEILEYLIKKNSFDLPEAMIDRELDFMWNTVRQQLAGQKMTPEQLGVSEQDYRKKNREEAIRRIKGFLLFDSIAIQNNIEVKEEEMNDRLTEIAKGYKQPLEAIKKFYQEQNLLRPLYNQILEERTLDFVLSKAKISEKTS